MQPLFVGMTYVNLGNAKQVILEAYDPEGKRCLIHHRDGKIQKAKWISLEKFYEFYGLWEPPQQA